jgi:hypothetical protein
MKFIILLAVQLLINNCTAQTIKVELIPGQIVMQDIKRFTGDTIIIKSDRLMPGRPYTLRLDNKEAPLGLQGYVYDAYLGHKIPVNPRDDYYEFTTTKDTLSTSPTRFYLCLVKSF